MFKKLLLIGLIGGAAFFALRGTKFFGLARDTVDEAQAWVDSRIPVEKEINRLRKEVANLDKDRGKVADLLAKEIVEVRYLRENTEELRTALATEEERLNKKAEAIKEAGDKQRLKYERYIVHVDEAKAMLKADVARFMTKKGTLKSQENTLAARERNKEYLEKQLDVLKRQKDALSVEVDALEADYNALKMQQMESKYATDSTRLTKIKDSLRELRKKMEIEKTKLELNPRVQDETPATTTGVGTASTTSQSVEEIMAPVTEKKSESAKK